MPRLHHLSVSSLSARHRYAGSHGLAATLEEVQADVSALIVTYNSADDIVACLRSIPGAFSRQEHIEVLVVDNASTDDTVKRIEDLGLGGLMIVVNGENVGFGRAVNQAAKLSSGRRVLLLNPDATLHSGAGTALLDFADAHPEHGFYGGRSFDLNGDIDPRSCWGLPTAWSTFCSAVGLSAAFRRSALFDPTSLGRWDRDTIRTVDVVSGCLLLADRGSWKRVNGFDEQFFLYGEDVDLGFRAKEAGFRPVVVPDAAITHAVSASTPDDVGQTRMLLTARSTFIRLRWTGMRRVWGLTMLGMGVLIRRLSELVRPRSRRWTNLWRDRSTWWPGYPPPPPAGDGPVGGVV